MIKLKSPIIFRQPALSEKINYRKKVNQQIAGAAFQLSLLTDQTLNLSSLQQSSCRQAGLHHLYNGICFYINEILSSYKREPIDFIAQSIDGLFSKNLLNQYEVIEFNELQQWYEKGGSLLAYLTDLSSHLAAADDQLKANKESNNEANSNLIQLVTVDEAINLLNNTQQLTSLKNELLSVIDRQRESLLEH